MRIIAGKWKGMHIEAPPGDKTRPILDRAKTVLFDVLGSRLAEPGRLPPIHVLDLFAGSGALGLEALSRGAKFALLVEQARAAAALIRRNLDILRIVDAARVLEGDATRVDLPAPPDGSYELVFMDPPYRMLAGPEPHGSVRGLLERLVRDTIVADSAIVVVRHERQPGGPPDLSPLIEIESRDVGNMTLRLLKRQEV
jgi:16S rRNA (guanine966-N2)-methyltransferase